MEPSIRFSEVTEKDLERVHSVLKCAPEYFLKVEGCLPSLETTRNELTTKPESKIENYRKTPLMITINEVDSGFIDLHINHPKVHISYIGLFLLKESLQGKGWGKKTFRIFTQFCKLTFETSIFRLGVSEKNDVEDYWTKMGFHRSGHTFTWNGINVSTECFEMEKDI